MVRPTCEVVSCSNEQTQTVSLHKVPNDEISSKPWTRFLQIANKKYPAWKPDKKTMRVCKDHFKPSAFKYGLSGTRLVLPGQFPCIVDGRDVSTEILKGLVEGRVLDNSHLNECGEAHEQTASNQMPIEKIQDVHENCNRVMKLQIECIKSQKDRIKKLEDQVSSLKTQISDLKNGRIRTLAQHCNRQQATIKRKDMEAVELKTEVKKLKLDWSLPEPSIPADLLLLEIVHRRHVPKNHPYSEAMKTFAFNAHYVSPKGYDYLRQSLPNLLPAPVNCYRWTKHVNISPGLIPISLHDIKLSSLSKSMYYALSFDEMALRLQILFDGIKMIGRCDYGNLSSVKPPAKLAKSVLICLATEINGHKSFPIAYAFTDGLKADVFADIVKTCIAAVEKANGKVLSISFDGLKSNFGAMKHLGADLDANVKSENVQPFFKTIPTSESQSESENRYYIVPDASHMFKLVRNTWERCRVLYNSDGKAIKWEYVQRLHAVQEQERLRAANKLTVRHVNFQQKKMNVKLCVQVLSNGTASAIDFCRKIGLPGFEGSEATTEFLRINNYKFDILNTRPYGEGDKAALSKMNKERWKTMINSAMAYYPHLTVELGNHLVPLYETKYGTCVKGIMTSLASVETILQGMEKGEIDLKYLPTYRLSQDPLELFFGGIRRRLGNNNNPNVAQLAYSLRAMLCFKLKTCTTGNCFAQEELLDRVSVLPNHEENNDNNDDDEYNQSVSSSRTEDFLQNIDLESFVNLSLFVENVVVYIAGFVCKKIRQTMQCTDCISSLCTSDTEAIMMREDFFLILEKDLGGLIKPSEDLIRVCKIVERLIRAEEIRSIFDLNTKRLEILVKQECIDRSVFKYIHSDINSCNFSKASHLIHVTHRMSLISEICKVYSKTRLNFIAKTSSLQAKPLTNRNKLTKLVHFSGC